MQCTSGYDDNVSGADVLFLSNAGPLYASPVGLLRTLKHNTAEKTTDLSDLTANGDGHDDELHTPKFVVLGCKLINVSKDCDTLWRFCIRVWSSHYTAGKNSRARARGTSWLAVERRFLYVAKGLQHISIWDSTLPDLIARRILDD
ncbi:hypothetical protein A0H81_09253 [Grifola frondosa]|uniref:Uncharacterized protein n=1 Tax=Grifola frondosa TaxID=5627 RepID=A0A1C7M2D1_GRIFR|nr:hypothetical protein A0H81_09253 [Grifola frondosa]